MSSVNFLDPHIKVSAFTVAQAWWEDIGHTEFSAYSVHNGEWLCNGQPMTGKGRKRLQQAMFMSLLPFALRLRDELPLNWTQARQRLENCSMLRDCPLVIKTQLDSANAPKTVAR